jgi:hypothetical protein
LVSTIIGLTRFVFGGERRVALKNEAESLIQGLFQGWVTVTSQASPRFSRLFDTSSPPAQSNNLK